MTKKIDIHPTLAINIAYHSLFKFTAGNSNSGNGPCNLYLMSGTVPTDPLSATDPLIVWKNNRIKANEISSVQPSENSKVWLSTYPAVATRSDVATWFYGLNSSSQQWFLGTVGLTGSGADLELNDVNIVQGKTYSISNLRIQVPTSFTYLSPTYAVASAADSVDEGSPLTFTVTTTNLPSPTTLYWVVLTNAGDFATSSGTVTINSNTGSFSVTPTSDTTTEVDAETFTVGIRTSALSESNVATSDPITINDTSQTPS